MKLNQNEAHKYWMDPPKQNYPKGYVNCWDRSFYLWSIMLPYMDSVGSILELGCNCGRNLKYISERSSANLFGIDINDSAIALGKELWGEEFALLGDTSIEGFAALQKGKFDVIFTMATLMHLTEKADFVYEKIVNLTGQYLITIEYEGKTSSERIYPRNYGDIFTSLGMKEIFEKLTDRFQVSSSSKKSPESNFYTTRIFRK